MPNVIVVKNTYLEADALRRVLDYVLRTPLAGGYAIDPDYACEQMMFVKQTYNKTEGVQMKHFIISFANYELNTMDFDDILALGFKVGEFFREFQLVYAIHTDTDNLHLHLVMNTVSFVDGHKYCEGLVGFQKLCGAIKALLPSIRLRLYY